MSERWQDEPWAQEMWWSGKTTRRRFLGLAASAAGALGATMLVPAPWREAFGQAKPFKIGTPPAAVGHGRRRRQDRAGRRADGGGPDQQGRRRQRPADRAPDRRLRVQARRRPPQGREAGRRGQDRRPRGRLSLQRLPGLHAGVRGAQDRQHDQRVPRHDDHPEQVQPLHLPAVRLRPGPGGGGRALHGQQDGQEVAHRLRRLRVGPVDQGRLRRRDQEERRRGRRHAPASRSAPPT